MNKETKRNKTKAKRSQKTIKTKQLGIKKI